MTTKQRTVQWIGGPQDGAHVNVPYDATWVAVLEDRRASTPQPPVMPDGTKPPPSLQRYTVPIIEGRIVWAQRKAAGPEDGA